MGVDGGHYVFAGDGFLVVHSVFVGVLDLVAGVPQEHVVALLPLQVHFPCGLQPRLPYVIPALVHSGVPLKVAFVHLGHIAQEVAAGVEGVFPHRTHLPAETREVVGALGEAHIFFDADLLREGKGLPAYA